MWLDYIISSPLVTLAMIELVLALILNTLLFYIVYKHTPIRMKDYRIILLHMALAQFFGAHGCIGAMFEYLYPIAVLRINGYFMYLGSTYGGQVTFILEIYFICSSGLRVLECSAYRFYTLKQQKFHLNQKLYLIFNLVLSLGFFALCTVLSKSFFQDKQDLMEYARIHNYSTVGINIEEDVLVIANVTSSTFYVIGCGLTGLVVLVAFIIYVLNLMIHRHMKQYISRVQISSINYQQQQRLTRLLVGQGSLPLLLATLPTIVLFFSIPELMANNTLPKSYFEIIMIAVCMYPLLGPLLTIVLTKPYFEAFRGMLLCRRPQQKVTRLSTIKL